MRALVVLLATLAVAVGVDVVTDAAHIGRIPVLAVASTFALTLVAKGLGLLGVQRPVGARPGEISEERMGDA